LYGSAPVGYISFREGSNDFGILETLCAGLDHTTILEDPDSTIYDYASP